MSVAQIAEGIHEIPDSQYFEIDLPSSSSTKTLLAGTNAHLAHERIVPREETDAFTLGAYVHALLLAPDTIETAFIKLGDIDRRTKDGKAEYESAQKRAALSGARIISRDLVAQGDAMAASVRSNPSAATLLNTLIYREVTLVGKIGERLAKCKADGIIQLAGACVCIDIKTTDSANPRDFASSAAKFGYFHQAAFYRRLIEQRVDVLDDFIVIAVEKRAPYLSAVYRIPNYAIDIADKRIDELVSRWWDVHDGDRTGYSPRIEELAPPPWWIGQD
jgi:exodeoxyribonuclease VIII